MAGGGLRALALGPWLCALLPTVLADLSFPHFSKDPQGRSSHIRLVGGSDLNYYSTEFVETCPETVGVWAPPIGDPASLTQTFQHPQVREDPNHGDLPDHTYLDDGQLDNPFAGRVSMGNYTEVVITKEFVADGDLVPLPHNRTQLCHYALRLTPPVRTQNTAAWFRFKQLVAYGFVTEFHFRILHRSNECKSDGRDSSWCQRAGGDGFAFVIQNDGRRIVGTEVGGLAYGFPNSIAIEFDTYRDAEFKDPSANHISVMVPREVGQPNTASHEVSQIAYTDDIPPLQEGTHHVRISYSTKQYQWDTLGRDFESHLTRDFRRLHSSGRPGLLTVELNGRRVIVVPFDLSWVVQVDGTATAQADPPKQPNTSAYDELGASPGRAWVGFTSSTGYEQTQSVDILSWTLTEEHPCPLDGSGDVMCRLNEGTNGRSTCWYDGSSLCSLIIQNAARTPISISAHLTYDRPYENALCDRGTLEWDALHPYFLGCARTVYFNYEMEELWINTLDGTRSVVVTEPHILQKAPMKFKRESLFRWCVLEHKHDFSRLYFAECNCEYCVRLLDIAASYAVFYQERCLARYGPLCPCFEASEVDHDSSNWEIQEPLQYMRIHSCRGCAYTWQCARMLKVAVCEEAYQPYRLGNPLAPTILSNGFTSMDRNEGRVPDGRLKGDACNCEPEVRPYRGDLEGKAGMCRDESELDRGNFPELSLCAAMCRGAAKCSYLTFWESTGECRIYTTCEWVTCTSLTWTANWCFQSATYRMAPLGSYTDTRGVMQAFHVFPQRTLQTEPGECFNCLHLYDEEHCYAQCGQPARVPYLHWPGGQLCATCMFAGNRMHELTEWEKQQVKACVYQAIRDSGDPWVECREVVQEHAAVSTLDLFNGVGTHFLTECPGRSFLEAGALCAPNIFATNFFPSQVLSRMAAISNTVWGPEMECVSATCQVVPRWSCYIRLGEWDFAGTLLESTGVLTGTAVGNPPPGFYMYESLWLQLGPRHAEYEQYVVTSPIPYDVENVTFEAWVTPAESYTVTNLAIGKPMTSSSHWRTDYDPLFATDGDMATYWSSQIGEEGRMLLDATWQVDLGSSSYAGSILIYWKEQAADFRIDISLDNATWQELISITSNVEQTSRIDRFFNARHIRLVITKAHTLRGPGIGENQPVVSIREFEVHLDDNLSRLKPTSIVYNWHRPAALALDGDNNTFWATPPGTEAASFLVDLGSVLTINIIRVEWRYLPARITFYISTDACVAGTLPGYEVITQVASQVQEVLLIEDTLQARCLGIAMQSGSVYGELLSGLDGIEAYGEADNVATGAAVHYTYPEETVDTWLSEIAGAMDGDPSTYWLVQPTDGTVSLTLDLGAPTWLMSITVRLATIAGIPYQASRFAVNVGLAADEMVEVHTVSAFLAMTSSFFIYQEVQFVNLLVTQIVPSNPDGKFALEDLIITAASDSYTQRATATGIASSEWASCENCTVSLDGNLRPHGTEMCVDNNPETWWGAQYGITGLAATYLEVIWDVGIAMELAYLSWRYPAQEVSALCASELGARLVLVGSTNGNTDYESTLVFSGTRTCQQMRILLGFPLEQLGGEGIIGVRELRIHDLSINWAVNRPAVASDGSSVNRVANVVDYDLATRWNSLSSSPTNVTIELGENRTAWGARVLFASNSIPMAFTLMASMNGVDYFVVQSFVENNEYDIYIIRNFVASYVILQLEETQWDIYSVRTVQVYGGENLVPFGTLAAQYSWDHSPFEAVDGNDTTFWLAEPLATTTDLTVDLSEETFVAGGITILWKFPAEDFSLWTSSDNVNWALLYNETGNLAFSTQIGGYFVARYVQVRMDRPSALNGDGCYAIYSFTARFDINLAHYKPMTISHIADASIFQESHAIDGAFETLWMPEQGSANSSLVLDLLIGTDISGFLVEWRYPPVRYSMEYQEPDTLEWILVEEWGLPTPDALDVGDRQEVIVGFPARRLRINVLAVRRLDQGEFVALRDCYIYVPDGPNMATGRQVEVSASEIVGNPMEAAVDGNIRGTYWMPGDGIREATFTLYFDELPWPEGAPPPYHIIGYVRIFWRYPPNDFYVELFHDVAWTTVHEQTGSTDDTTIFRLYKKATKMRIHISTVDSNIGIRDIDVKTAIVSRPPAATPRENPWNVSLAALNDLNQDSYWMQPPGRLGPVVEMRLDLLKVYNAWDIAVWFGFKPQVIEAHISTDGTDERMVRMTSKSTPGLVTLETTVEPFLMRHFRLLILRGFEDEEGQFGTTIRDTAVYIFSNIARLKNATADSVWDYPAYRVVDPDSSTYWMSRWNTQTATVTVDLGDAYNIAGMSFIMGYGVRRFEIRYRLENETRWELARREQGEHLGEVTLASWIQFKARYVQLWMSEPLIKVWHPDQFEVENTDAHIISVHDWKIWEHPGGGGVIGLQSLDGMEYSTITYGIREPGEWLLTSEGDKHTQDLNGGIMLEDVGQMVHLVVTFQTVEVGENARTSEIAFYRNGLPYGQPYRTTMPKDRLKHANQTRMVFGVRSSAHHQQPGDRDPRNGVRHGTSHTPYFDGKIHSAGVVRNALTPEEVRGVYLGSELGCHCYDACPVGSNRFFYGVPIPCSGQGVCRRSDAGKPLELGFCDCNPGYSGDACENHCSELSEHGCCEVDDDCPWGIFCIQETKACSQ